MLICCQRDIMKTNSKLFFEKQRYRFLKYLCSMEEIKQNSLRAWILAARPKTLAGAATPVLVGTALAYADGQFHWLPALVCFLFAGLMQIAANFINDLFDFLKGTDREDRLGPERSLCTRLDFSRCHETGNIIYRSHSMSYRMYTTVLCRLAVDTRGDTMCNVRFLLYHRALSPFVQRLGRCTGNRVFRICPGRRHLLRTGTHMDSECNNSFIHLRIDRRYSIGSK